MTSGNLVGNVDFTIDVGPRLVKGVFAIEPESGFPGTTEFVIKVYDWQVLGLSDIISYDVVMYLKEEEYQEMLDLTLTKQKFYWELIKD